MAVLEAVFDRPITVSQTAVIKTPASDVVYEMTTLLDTGEEMSFIRRTP